MIIVAIGWALLLVSLFSSYYICNKLGILGLITMLYAITLAILLICTDANSNSVNHKEVHIPPEIIQNESR